MPTPIEAVKKILRERFLVPASSIHEVRERFEQLADDLPPAQVHAEVESTVIGGVPGASVRAESVTGDGAILFLHGGGYNCGSTHVYRNFMIRLSHHCQTRVVGLDYRLAPEHPFPAAVDDAAAGYRALIEETDPANIAFVGDSAGGGLVLGTLVALRDTGDPMPRKAVCISPWTDLEGLGESMRARADADPWIRPERVYLSTRLYVSDQDIRHPYAAPLHADPAGLPPMLIIVGDHEVLRDDSTRFAEKAKAADVDVTLEVWDRMVHVWPFFAGILPEGAQAFERIAEFLR